MKKWFSDILAENGKKELQKSFIFTYLWGLAAHGYMLLSNSISHDSVGEFLLLPHTIETKLASGRIFAPVVQWLRGSISAPWWVGILSLFFLSIALFLIIRMFDIRKDWMICLTSGVLTVNLSYAALIATYIHDLDSDSLAVALSVLAVYLWRTQSRGWLYGIIPVALSLGLYQSFISVTITLIIILSILDLMNNRSFKEVFPAGLRSVMMLLCGGVLYFCLQKIAVSLYSASLPTAYNAVTQVFELTPLRMVKLLAETWFASLYEIIVATSGLPLRLGMVINGGVILICVAILIEKLFCRSMGVPEKILLMVLFLLLPVGANVTRVLSNGWSHDLMHYALWLIYLLALVLTRDAVHQASNTKHKVSQIVAVVLVAVTLLGNVQMANCIYTAKRFVQNANLSLFTRIVADIEDMEDYVIGETPICFVGEPEYAMSPLPKQYRRYYTTGAKSSFAISTKNRDHYQCYFDHVLMNPGVIADNEVVYAMNNDPQVLAMPLYPQDGSIAMVDGVVVVKLGND